MLIFLNFQSFTVAVTGKAFKLLHLAHEVVDGLVGSGK